MSLAISDFRWSEHALKKRTAAAADCGFDSVHARNIHAQANDHFFSDLITRRDPHSVEQASEPVTQETLWVVALATT
jgi:hypothetical protein